MATRDRKTPQPMQEAPPEVMTPKEAARYLRVALPTLYRRLTRGQIPAVKFGTRWRLHKAALDEYMRGGWRAARGFGSAIPGDGVTHG